MKKITAILMVMLVMTALLLPTVMAENSPERGILIVATKDELPEPSAESPDFVFVQDESVVYVKLTDNDGNPYYEPETTAGDDFGYVVTEEQTWYMGTADKGLTFKSTADFGKFVAVYVDGQEVAADNYTAYEGSTMIDLKPEYLESLGVGDYKITILSNDGSGSCPFHIKASSSPTPVNPGQTGDDSNTGMWVAIALVALGAIGVVVLTLVKTRKSAER